LRDGAADVGTADAKVSGTAMLTTDPAARSTRDGHRTIRRA
jgi:hypothetical protein